MLGERGLTSSQFAQAKQTARKILLSLEESDLVAVYTFTALLASASRQFLPATSKNVAALVAWLDAVKAPPTPRAELKAHLDTVLSAVMSMVQRESSSCLPGRGAEVILFQSGGERATFFRLSAESREELIRENREQCGQGADQRCIRVQSFSLGSGTAEGTALKELADADGEAFGNTDVTVEADLVGCGESSQR